jgi:hypothetical protein
MFVCELCNYSTTIKNSFNVHNKTIKHQNNLEIFNKKNKKQTKVSTNKKTNKTTNKTTNKITNNKKKSENKLIIEDEPQNINKLIIEDEPKIKNKLIIKDEPKNTNKLIIEDIYQEKKQIDNKIILNNNILNDNLLNIITILMLELIKQSKKNKLYIGKKFNYTNINIDKYINNEIKELFLNNNTELEKIFDIFLTKYVNIINLSQYPDILNNKKTSKLIIKINDKYGLLFNNKIEI